MLPLRPEVPRRTAAQARARARSALRVAVAVALTAPLVAAVAAVPHLLARFGSDGPDLVHDEAVDLATKAYERWAAVHPAATCPSSIGELARYARDDRVADPWGSRFVLVCAAGHVMVLSGGPDGRLGTSDDVRGDGP